jgi:demethylmenaquinone methyltransferase/2-methoxy-6-polyprenyl-1,4-benzoquinol methylase
MKEVTPYNEDGRSKKEQVEQMFDNIAGQYDLLNRVLSLGIDKGWRRQMVNIVNGFQHPKVLDMATGTADVAIDIVKGVRGAKVTGVDLSAKMLDIGRDKIDKRGMSDSINLIKGDCEDLPFESNTFDVATVAFGVRNFQNSQKGLEEMHRVLMPGGKLVILEFSKPRQIPFKQIYNIYFKYVLPQIGRLSSKDAKAYSYLYDSVQAFPDYEDFLELMKASGYLNCEYKSLTFGICCIYLGDKS